MDGLSKNYRRQNDKKFECIVMYGMTFTFERAMLYVYAVINYHTRGVSFERDNSSYNVRMVFFRLSQGSIAYFCSNIISLKGFLRRGVDSNSNYGNRIIQIIFSTFILNFHTCILFSILFSQPSNFSRTLPRNPMHIYTHANPKPSSIPASIWSDALRRVGVPYGWNTTCAGSTRLAFAVRCAAPTATRYYTHSLTLSLSTPRFTKVAPASKFCARVFPRMLRFYIARTAPI